MKKISFYLLSFSLLVFSFRQLYAQTPNAVNPTPPAVNLPPANPNPMPPTENPQNTTPTPNPQNPNPTPNPDPQNPTTSTPEAPSELSTLQQRIFSLQTQLSDLNVYLSSLQVQLNELINGDEKTQSLEKVQDLQKKLMDTDTKLKSIREELGALEKEIQQLKNPDPSETAPSTDTTEILNNLEKRVSHLEREIQNLLGPKQNSPAMNETKQDLEDHLENELQTGDATIDSDRNSIKIKLNGNILFQEGEVSLSPQGQDTLIKIAPVLKNLKDKVVFVIGHSDRKPIGPNLRDFYPSNWELSTTRGTMVVRYLQTLGVSPSMMVAAGRSFYEPSEDGLDRRAEIWIFPKLLSQSQSLDSAL